MHVVRSVQFHAQQSASVVKAAPLKYLPYNDVICRVAQNWYIFVCLDEVSKCFHCQNQE